jgi:hypothetical protein
MARSSKIETYAVQWLALKGYDVAFISKELKIEEEKVRSILEKGENIDNNNKIKNGSSSVKAGEQNLMINETAVKRTKSVSVMTEAASQRNDETLKNMQPQAKHSEAIFRPHG